eukprot:Hpha_TRINITY_DN10779_c0_g1::TRINITY_DN10779_c0_g1_i1::g.43632::m.43632/K00486/KMO; kynurenine 3-monooxygenase
MVDDATRLVLRAAASNPDTNKRICILGAGPAGLAAALAFHNVGFQDIYVYEDREEAVVRQQAAEESYPIGVNPRGRRGLQDVITQHKAIEEPGGQERSDRFFSEAFAALGGYVQSWDIMVSRWEWRVAQFRSGQVIGTTRSAVVQMLLAEIKRRSEQHPGVHVHYGHKAVAADIPSRTLTLETGEGPTRVSADLLIVANGFRSRIRDSLAEQEKAARTQAPLAVRQWEWNTTFRVLVGRRPEVQKAQPQPKEALDPAVHYIVNGVYVAKIPDGRWVAVMSTKDGDKSSEFLLSKEQSPENATKLREHLAARAPRVVHQFDDEEYTNFFGRPTFTGAVTWVSKLSVDNWALLIGDAAHAVIPASGEGINSSLEDASVIQRMLSRVYTADPPPDGNHLAAFLSQFEAERLPDAHALTNIAYSYARGGAKAALQSVATKILGRRSKEELMYGPDSSRPMRYSDIVAEWDQQTKWLGGRPGIPPAPAAA